MTIAEQVQLGVQITTLVGVLFAVYRFFRKPDEDAEKNIAVLTEGCNLKHKGIDQDITAIKRSIMLIQENDLKHIESEIRSIREENVKIITILNERLPNKN